MRDLRPAQQKRKFRVIEAIMRDFWMRLQSNLAGSMLVISLLTIPSVALGQSQFAGVYTGTFSGPSNDGEFAVLVRENNIAIAAAFDAIDGVGFINENVAVNSDGSFTAINIDGEGTSLSGTFTSSGVSGTFVDVDGAGIFSGTKLPADGVLRELGGFYTGSMSGIISLDGSPIGTFSGDWFLILSANGVSFNFIDGSASAQGQVEPFQVGVLQTGSTPESICQSINLGSINVTCTFNSTTFTLSGTFNISSGGLTVAGTFSLTRQLPLPVPNNPPVAANDSYSVTANRTLTVDAAEGVLVNDSDPDGDPLTANLASTAPNGTLALSGNGGFTYTPDSGFTGADSFTYRASDGLTTSNLATVTITVEPIPMPWLSLLLD
jgi:hypothetical protein